jgi:hypothetical protein
MKCLITILLFQVFSFTQISASCLKGNCKVGNGTYQFKDGSKYTGQFYKGLPHGRGEMVMSIGDRYEGSFKLGKKHGEGKYLFSSGNKYQGQFEYDKISGKGRMDYANNKIYKGQWKNNKPHGRGTLITTDRKHIEGLWRSGKLVKRWKTSTSPIPESNSSSTRVKVNAAYKNCNKDYCHNEKGKFTYGDGSYYIGEFLKGSPEGKGTCYYINGDIYEGGWRNHGPNGEGVITFTSGRRYSAIWESGKPVKQMFDKPVIEDKEYNRKRNEGDGVTDMYALVIGISSYDHMPTLKYPDDDAYQLYAFLKSPEGGALPENHITLLVDEVATRENIRTSMKTVFGKADKDDVVIMYYSGHGLQGRFLPIDFDGYKNSLSHREIYDLLGNSAAKNKVLIADACYSGSLSDSKGTFYNSLENFYSKMGDSEGGTAIMMSSKAEEQSLEYSGLRQGVFSHFLLKGMKGHADYNGDTIVSITELFRFISDGVKSYTNNRQSPTISGNFDQHMPIAMIRK